MSKRATRTRSLRPPGPISPLGPDLPDLQQARALWQLNRFDEALAGFDRAVRRCPNNSLALVDASRAFGARFEIARAEELLDRLIEINGRRADVLHLAGQSYRMIFRPDKAADCFRRALALNAALTDTRLELALQCERRHRLEEALSLVEEGLKLDPEYHAMTLIKARLLRRSGQDAAAESLLRRLADDAAVHPQLQAQAWAELAQLLDRAGQFDDAMASMLRCKEIVRADEAPFWRESEVLLRHLDDVGSGVTADHLGRWRAQASNELSPRRHAVLCGFPRTGTTLLEQVLDSHSDLVSSDEREAFARDIFPSMWQSRTTPVPGLEALDAIPSERLVALRSRYFGYLEAALNEPIGGRMHLDKNPTLTLLLPAMLRLVPETRVVLALRDPRDVVVSCFMQFLPLNPNSVSFLTLERTAQRYAHDMESWRQLRDRFEGWIEVRYEDTVLQLEREARRVLEFLGLPWEAGVLQYRDRLRDKPVASPTYEAVSKPLYTSAMGRWRNYEKHLEPVLKLLEPSIGAFRY